MIYWWVYAILAAVAGTARELFRKKGLVKEHTLDFELTRTTFAALFGILLIPWLTFRYTFSSLLIAYFVSLIVSIGILLMSKSLKHDQISEVVPLTNLTPGFLAVLAFLFLGETLTGFQIAGIVLLIMGAYVLETDNHSIFKTFLRHIRAKYVEYAIASALIFSVAALLDKFIITNYLPALDFFFIEWIFISLNFIIFTSIFNNGIRGIKHCLKRSKHYVVFAAFFAFLSNAFYFLAISISFVSLVIPIRKLSTLFITLIGGGMFHEDHLIRKSIAAFIMIFGATIIILL